MTGKLASKLDSRLRASSGRQLVDHLFDFIQQHGQSNYDESVRQIEHALQCGQLARERGLPDEAVAAALLHDVGHLLLDEHDHQDDFLDQDLNHELAGYQLLKTYFPEGVTEPIRMHVVAKRYLCTTEPDYYASLSPASQRSFRVQGGPLPAAELAELERNPFLPLAVELRRIDDQGKVSGLPTAALEAYGETVAGSLRPEWR